MKLELFLLIWVLSLNIGHSQTTTVIDDIRLGGRSNGYSGRVEIQYNGTWGTICDNSWSQNDATVACRMLNFTGAECYRTNAYFGRASSAVPIWMDRLLCNGREAYLDNCPFRGWGPSYHFCTSHRDDASVVCRNDSLLTPPRLSVVSTTTRSITVTWPNVVPSISLYQKRYRIQYNTSGSSPRYIFRTTSISYRGLLSATISNLLRDRNYSISVRIEVTSTACRRYSYYNMYSFYSMPITVATNKTVRPSAFDVRLVPAIRQLDFLGRVEINYNGTTWGTVCDYQFDNTDANVICQMLNYTRAACSIYNARFGRGSGKIWLTRLSCASAEILDDCSYTFYNPFSYSSTRNCRTTHYDDAGVICVPGKGEFLPAPRNFTAAASDSSSTTVIFTWERYIFPSYVSSRRFHVRYTRSDRTGIYTLTIYTSLSTYYLTRLSIGVTINATLTPQGRFTQYGCYTYLDGDTSEYTSTTTMERPPSTAPRNFHISVVNCSAIMTEWDLPSSSTINGVLRGFKLIYQAIDGTETTKVLPANVTEYIIQGLLPSTSYVVSVLAYTVGDGPRSIHLTVITNERTICQTDVIDFFGINGNDFDKITLYSFSSSINIFCGSSFPNAQLNWFYSNGTRVGVSNRHIREGHFKNGTIVLQIGNERRLTVCDADIYTCRANVTTSSGSQRGQQRTFKLTFNRGPPTPGRPVVLKLDSNTATITWPKIDCDGGHDLQFYNIRIGYYRSSFYSSLTYRYLYSIDARLKNYTLAGLTPTNTYYVYLRAVGRDNTLSGYSSAISLTTLPPAPTPPRYVNVQLITPNVILVYWTRPAVTNGDIVYYTVYATPFISRTSFNPRNKRQTESLRTVSKNFTAAMTSGNITLPQLGVEYHVQVSVTVADSRSSINRKSLVSSLTSNSTLFVPLQGLPIPTNVMVTSSTNNSLTVTWVTPTSTGDTITGYLVEYSGTVDGESPDGTYIKYTQEGNFTTAANVNSFKLQPLVPQTNYQLKLSALTTRGEGMQVTITGTTRSAKSEFERYVYFHVRFGPVLNCPSFRRDIEGQEDSVDQQIFGYLKTTCNCGFSDNNIETGYFSCGQQDHQIIYRAHILGTGNYSAIGLVELLQNWIQSNRAYVVVNNFRMQLDPTCPTRLDTLEDPECPVVTQTPPTIVTTTSPTTEKPTLPKTKPISTTEKQTQQPKETEKTEDDKPDKESQIGNVQPQNQQSGISASALAGMFVGLIIGFLLLILIVLIIVIFFSKLNKKSSGKDQSHVPVGFTNQRSAMRFSELEESSDKMNTEQKIDDNFLYSGDMEKFEDNFN